MSIRLIAGDCRDVLLTLAAESVQCVVCSPPYYGLRDYGTALWDGGDVGCDHARQRGMGATTLRLDGREHLGVYDGEKATQIGTPFRDVCGRCGAVRVDRQIGLEQSPEAYLAVMVGVFREVRRVLRSDGTCWVNMGDSYALGGKSTPQDISGRNAAYGNGRSHARWDLSVRAPTPMGLAAKQLLLMPARLALALQQDGWWVRSDIIWHKPNPMPESVTDRPTSAHEHVFLLTRSSRYYYDADAVREGADPTYAPRYNSPFNVGEKEANGAGRPGGYSNTAGMKQFTGSRNLRNVWTIATHAYSESHFATMPPAVVERCIRAGTSERGCCAACGKPWVRVTEHTRGWDGSRYGERLEHRLSQGGGAAASTLGSSNGKLVGTTTTTGWAPGCRCRSDACDAPYEVIPCTVLDPFAGAGTTLLVADRLQRDAVGIELNAQYTEMAMERCRADAPLFTSFPPAEPPEDERMGDLFTGMAAD